MSRQNDALLALLRRRGPAGVTPLDGLNIVGSFRLAGRVHELRKAGYRIRRDWWETPNGARVARYVIEERTVDRVAEAPELGL